MKNQQKLLVEKLAELGNDAIGASVYVSEQYGGGKGKTGTLGGWTNGDNPTVLVKIGGYWKKDVPLNEVTLCGDLEELHSVGCWINTNTGTVYPCQVSGCPDFELSSELEELEVEWVKVLSESDLAVLASTLFRMWEKEELAKQLHQ